MKKTPYLPTTAPNRVIWLNTFATKIGGYATTFGLSTAEVTAITVMAAFYSYMVNLADQAKSFKEDITKFIGTLSVAPVGTTLGPIPAFSPAAAPTASPAGIFTLVAGIVKRIKGHAAYTTSIGEDLGIIGDEQVLDETNFQSEITAAAQLDGVKITFTKKGVDGVNVYSNPIGKFDSAEWEFLSLDLHTPYLDSRPAQKAGVPEKRRYMVIGVLDDKEIGVASKTVEVTFSPALLTPGHPVIN